MPTRKLLNLLYVSILTVVGVTAALNVNDIKKFLCKKGFEHHGAMIVQYREPIRRKFDELTVKLRDAGHNHPDRAKWLGQYIFVCEQILPFDEPRKSACNHNMNVFLGDGCIRAVHLNHLSETELHQYLADRFQMNILLHGDFMGAMELKQKDLYHASRLSWYLGQMAEDAESKERNFLTARLMKETYHKDRDLLRQYKNKMLTLDEFKKQVIDFKIATMKQTPDWKRGCWKGYVVNGERKE